MSDQDFRKIRSVPAGLDGRPAQQPQEQVVEPDYLALAAGQLARAHHGVTALAKSKGENGEADPDIIAMRLKLAEGYTALADIQYSVPDEGDGDLPGYYDEAEEEDDRNHRRR